MFFGSRSRVEFVERVKLVGISGLDVLHAEFTQELLLDHGKRHTGKIGQSNQVVSSRRGRCRGLDDQRLEHLFQRLLTAENAMQIALASERTPRVLQIKSSKLPPVLDVLIHGYHSR